MIKLENTCVMNLENALRGARNPMSSWERSDSFWDEKHNYILGPNDLSLARRLCTAGPDHRKFIRQIFVSLDITAPLYWWKEADTYKVGTVANSCSTMHKIAEKEFTLGDFSTEHFRWISERCLKDTIDVLNGYRNDYIRTKDKDYWWQMIQLLPSSYNQTRNVMLNYEVLANIYRQRKNHKLDEWREVCKWIENLPYSELITGEEE